MYTLLQGALGSRLEAVRVNFKAQLITFLSRKNPLNVVNEVLSNPNRLVE